MKLWEKDKTQAALERLDQLTKDEILSVAAQTLGVVHGLADNIKEVMGGAHILSYPRATGIVVADSSASLLFNKNQMN